MENPTRLFLATLALLLSPVNAWCGSNIPYVKLYDLFERGAKIKSPNLRPIFVIASSDKAIKPSSITLTIQAKVGPIEIKIDPDGEIRSFPLTAELLKENPNVLTNQPKGTLKIGGGMGIVLPGDNLTFSYRELNDLVVQASAEMKKQAGMLLQFLVPTAKGLIFEFSSPRKQTVTIAYKNGPQVLQAGSDGGITLPLDKTSLAENPTVTLSEKPHKVSIDM
ncbi:MAG: DUF2987 domain-containing protein [Verrucomicrobiota bacterium]|nr:DUF2987 domain-containing protein [Verrucomicrobiota bacterium]